MTLQQSTARNDWQEIPKTDDPKEFLESVMSHSGIAMENRIEAAKALMPYYHERLCAAKTTRTTADLVCCLRVA